MTTTRLEAFSDAVIAIIMTIMVLELKVPQGETFGVLKPVFPVLLAYLLSFVYLGIYWINHHHMLQATQKVGGKILWANMHLLFWLSLVPFATAWMGANHFAAMPTGVYGVVLFMCALAYTLLQTTIVKHHDGENDILAKAVGNNLKGKVSMGCYVLAIGFALVQENISHVLYVVVALMWLVPDRRIEKKLDE